MSNSRYKEFKRAYRLCSTEKYAFFGDIESNISFGRDISRDEILESASIAQASEFINNKEEGYNH